jgi:hypothetical protein
MEDSKDSHFIQIIQDYYIDFYSKIMEFVSYCGFLLLIILRQYIILFINYNNMNHARADQHNKY